MTMSEEKQQSSPKLASEMPESTPETPAQEPPKPEEHVVSPETGCAEDLPKEIPSDDASAESSTTEEGKEKDEEVRIGAFICHCGVNIGGFIDVPSVVDYVATLPNVAHAERNLFTCAEDGLNSIKKAIKEKNLNRVISIKQRIKQIKELLGSKKLVNFNDILGSSKDRVDMIVSFLGLLELVKQRHVYLEQGGVFEGIQIRKL